MTVLQPLQTNLTEIITTKQAFPCITCGQHGAKSESPGSLPVCSLGTFALNNICRVWYPHCQFEDLISGWASSVYLMNSSFVPTGSASLMNGSLCLSLSACVCLLYLKSTASGSRAQRQDLSLSRVRVHLWMVSVVCPALFSYGQCLDFKSGNLAAIHGKKSNETGAGLPQSVIISLRQHCGVSALLRKV